MVLADVAERADQSHRAVVVHGAAVVRPVRAEDAVVLEVRFQSYWLVVVLHTPRQLVPTIGPLPGHWRFVIHCGSIESGRPTVSRH